MSDAAHILTRRQTFGIAAGVTTGAFHTGSPSAAAVPDQRAWRGGRTQNHWPGVGRGHTDTFRIEGTGSVVPFLPDRRR